MLKKSYQYILRKARNPFKALKILLKRRLGWLGVPTILPYTAYGNQEKVFLTGAVIEDKGLARPEPGQSRWQNVLAMVKRYAGDEIAGVRVKIAYRGLEETVQTNEQGLFHTVLSTGHQDLSVSSSGMVAYTLLDEVVEGQGRIHAEGEVHMIREDAPHIVVSDMDDTVLISHSTRTFKKLRLMLFRNALTRSSFEGVAAFYRALCQPGTARDNPIFYVSSSEWNLFDLLADFLDFNDIPQGSLLLSSNNLNLFRIRRSGKQHHEKLQRIVELFEHYHRQAFILIGDSGQKDPEIYLKILTMFPSRVKCIYIRYIKDRKRNRRLDTLIAEARELGAEMIPVHSTTEAASHALRQGYIHEEHWMEIALEKQKEEKSRGQ
jgi:phosphatidate phosphatase APP1